MDNGTMITPTTDSDYFSDMQNTCLQFIDAEQTVFYVKVLYRTYIISLLYIGILWKKKN